VSMQTRYLRKAAMRALRAVPAAVICLALFAGPAIAQEGDAYPPPIPPEILGNPPGNGSGAPGEPRNAAASLPATVIPASDRADERAGGASLPLTGLQIALIVTGAAGLFLLGVAMRRAGDSSGSGVPRA